MSIPEVLFTALKSHGIEILSVRDAYIIVQNNYEIEIESNGLYKLFSDGYVIAPFDNVSELCQFIIDDSQ